MAIWNVVKVDEDKINEVSKKYNISKTLAKMILTRGIQDVDMYLNGTLDDLRDPFLLKDMDKFVARIKQAKENNEKICIYGDYDVDGITSVTVMKRFLNTLGIDVMFYLPNRLKEGYGINKEALDKIKNEGVSLVISVDCGITAIDEVEYAKKIGLDICITDHHEVGEIIPDAIAVVNPKQKDDNYPFKLFAGVGVAFKCIMALSMEYNLDKSSYLKYLDIVAIGTIADIVALVDENRIIAKYGIEKLKNTNNIGLKSLLEILNYKDIDSTFISFMIAPRINACGRMGDAYVAANLFLSDDEKVAKELALKLDEMNIKRQSIEKEIFDSSIKRIENSEIKNKNSIVLYDENWHNGVIGIVASRLVSTYTKPVILLTKENGVIRGSGRAPNGFSLYNALNYCKESLIQFGGHELAARFIN